MTGTSDAIEPRLRMTASFYSCMHALYRGCRALLFFHPKRKSMPSCVLAPPCPCAAVSLRRYAVGRCASVPVCRYEGVPSCYPHAYGRLTLPLWDSESLGRLGWPIKAFTWRSCAFAKNSLLRYTAAAAALIMEEGARKWTRVPCTRQSVPLSTCSVVHDGGLIWWEGVKVCASCLRPSHGRAREATGEAQALRSAPLLASCCHPHR